MELSVESLRGSGGFTGAPVKREVTWESGGESYTADVYVRRLSYYTAVTDVYAIAGKGDLGAGRIASCICDAEGKPIFKMSDITGMYEDGTLVMDEDPEGNPVERGALDDALAMALLVVIGEVNELGKPKAKTSSRKKNSGTS